MLFSNLTNHKKSRIIVQMEISMHVVTGAAGFIGSNMVAHLNKQGHTNIVCVDTLNQSKVANLAGLQFEDFIHPVELMDMNLEDSTVWHLGANSRTSTDDWDSIYHSNVVYTKHIINKCRDVVFASSASVYGDNEDTREVPENEAPKNMYAATKLICDNYIAQNMSNHKKYQSWRFFNVYGNRESHKLDDKMGSPYTNFVKQARERNVIEIFRNSNQVYRDFICVDDVVNIMYKTHQQCDHGFISNLGTGDNWSFQYWAELIAKHYSADIEYIEVPQALQGIYQMYTRSNNTALLNRIGDYKFITPEEFVEANL